MDFVPYVLTFIGGAIVGAVVAVPIVRNNFKDVNNFMNGIETNDIPKIMDAIKNKVNEAQALLDKVKATGIKL